MPRFSAAACSTPNRLAKKPAGEGAVATAAAAPATRAKAVPRASDVVIVEQGPRPQRQPARLPTSAPVDICIYLVSENAADVWSSAYEGSQGVSVWQIQMEHKARPSVMFDLVGSWNDFLKKAHAEDESIPGSLTDLTVQCGCKLVIADAADPEAVGFVQWRAAWYVAGEETSALDNMLALLDGWLCHKAAQAAKEQPFEVRLHPHTGIELGGTDDFTYEHWVVEEPATKLPLGYFEAQPVVGKRVVTLHLEAVNDETVNLLLAGNIWSYRSRLDSLGVSGAYHEAEGGGEKTYYRVMKGVNGASDKSRVLDLLGDGCFKKLALRVVVDKEPDAGSAAGALLAELRELPQLRFV